MAASSWSIAVSSEGRQAPAWRAEGQMPGSLAALRWTEARSWFTPDDELGNNLWCSPDPRRSPPARESAPSRRSSRAPGGLPKPGKLVVTLLNNHLQYALTWYGLAGVPVISFVTWAFGSEEAGGAEDAPPTARRLCDPLFYQCGIRPRQAPVPPRAETHAKSVTYRKRRAKVVALRR
jgi:hypothetical protein